MTYTIVLLSFFLIFITLLYPRNKYTWLLALMILGIELVLFSLLKTAGEIGNYSMPLDNSLFYYDYRIYIYLTRIPISHQQIATFGYLGITIFIYATSLLALIYLGNARRWERVKIRGGIFYLTIFPTLYFYSFSAQTRYNIYLMYFSRKLSIFNLIHAFNILFNFVLVIHLLLPMMMVFIVYYRASSEYRKRQTIILLSNMFVMEIIFAIIYFGGPTRRFFNDVQSMQAMLLNHAWRFSDPLLFYRILPIIIFISTVLNMIILLNIGGLNLLRHRIPPRIIKSNQRYNSNMRGVFHSFKNIFFSYSAVLSDMRECYTSPEMLACIERLEKITQTSIENISIALNSLRMPNYLNQSTEVIKALKNAIKKCVQIEGIQIDLQTNCECCWVFFSEYQFIEVMVNLFQNAQEAVLAAKREQGLVTVKVIIDDVATIIQVTDNGTGISQNDRRHIFEAFYSTKKIGKNWGLGLNYSTMAVSAYGGLIYVQTKQNVGTTFELVLRNSR